MYNLTLNLGKDVNKVLINQICVIGGTNGFETKVILDVKRGYIIKFESKSFFNLNYTTMIKSLKNLFQQKGLDLNAYISLSEES